MGHSPATTIHNKTNHSAHQNPADTMNLLQSVDSMNIKSAVYVIQLIVILNDTLQQQQTNFHSNYQRATNHENMISLSAA